MGIQEGAVLPDDRMARRPFQRALPMVVAALGILLVLAVGGSAEATGRCAEELQSSADRVAWVAALEAGCPCESFSNHRDYVRCAARVFERDGATVGLSSRCRQRAVRVARQSTCGRDDAVVCCGATASGRPHYRIKTEASQCRSPKGRACVSPMSHIATGCGAGTCNPRCGNAILEDGEECDDPSDPLCRDCVSIDPGCGNGVIEVGEECDDADDPYCVGCLLNQCAELPATCSAAAVGGAPECDTPGAGACDRNCRLGSCPAALAGEIELGCAEAGRDVSASVQGDTFLVAWESLHHRSRRLEGYDYEQMDILVRRLDTDGLPLEDDVEVPTEDWRCGGCSDGISPALASSGDESMLVWRSDCSVAYARLIGTPPPWLIPRRWAYTYPSDAGQCQQLAALVGPSVATVSPSGDWTAGMSRAAVSGCVGGWSAAGRGALAAPINWANPFYEDRSFYLRVGTWVVRYFECESPVAGSDCGPPEGSIDVDSGSPGTLWVAFGMRDYDGSGSPERFLQATPQVDGAPTATVEISTRNATHYYASPSVAAGDATFLVTWSQKAHSMSAAVDEIRILRTGTDGTRLGADGGSLAAEVPRGVVGGPVATWTGTDWPLVWAQAAESGDELWSMRVAADGQAQGATRHRIAVNVVADPGILWPDSLLGVFYPGGDGPAIHAFDAVSVGDGRALIVYQRGDGMHRSILAQVIAEP